MPGTDLEPTTGPTLPTDLPAADPADLGGHADEVSPVAPDLVFTTSKKDRTGSDVGQELRFEVDGETYTALRPTDDAFVLMTTAGARSLPMPDRMAAIIGFLDNALSEESGVRLRDRLLDRDDDFGFEDLLDILQKIVKHWADAGRPRQARQRGTRRRR